MVAFSRECWAVGSAMVMFGRACTYLEVLATTADDALDRHKSGQRFQGRNHLVKQRLALDKRLLRM
jgi:hypothetical protein